MNAGLDWGFLRDPALAALLLDGLLRTFAVALAAAALAVAFGLALGALRASRSASARALGALLVALARNVPALFWIMCFYYVLPDALPAALGDALHGWGGYAGVAGVLGLAVDGGAALADPLRRALLRSARRRRGEAGPAGPSLHLDARPALRIAAPQIGERSIHAFKGTTLCVAVALPELTWATQQIESITFQSLEPALLATAVYAGVAGAAAALLARAARRRGTPVPAPWPPAAPAPGPAVATARRPPRRAAGARP